MPVHDVSQYGRGRYTADILQPARIEAEGKVIEQRVRYDECDHAGTRDETVRCEVRAAPQSTAHERPHRNPDGDDYHQSCYREQHDEPVVLIARCNPRVPGEKQGGENCDREKCG